jgi:adenosylcobinamide kinase/adenosylcobinamide-phosphate guanylyltransferase
MRGGRSNTTAHVFVGVYNLICFEERICAFMTKHQDDFCADRPQAAQLILVLGGARSGKSAFAERLAARSGRSVAYIATATASDDDMRNRIAHHQAARPTSWQTIEEPLELGDAVSRGALAADVILLDCITLWVGNWLMSQGETDFDDPSLITGRYYEGAIARIDALLAVVGSLGADKTLIVVSNEVGLGIVPAYALGRLYRDLLGLLNQRLATAATRVYLMVAGLGVDIKRLYEDAVL